VIGEGKVVTRLQRAFYMGMCRDGRTVGGAYGLLVSFIILAQAADFLLTPEMPSVIMPCSNSGVMGCGRR